MSKIANKIAMARAEYAKKFAQRDNRIIQQRARQGAQNTVDDDGKEIICPMMRASINTGVLELDGKDRVSKENAGEYVHFFLGLPKFVGYLAGTSVDHHSGLFDLSFNPENIRDGHALTPNESEILRSGEFSEEAFQRMTTFANADEDGKITLSEWKAALDEHADTPGIKGAVGLGIAKIAAKFLFDALGRDLGDIEVKEGLFGTSFGASVRVDPAITIDDLRNLFQHKVFPEHITDRIIPLPSNEFSEGAKELERSVLGGSQGRAADGALRFARESAGSSTGVLANQGLKTAICPQGGVDTSNNVAGTNTVELHNELSVNQTNAQKEIS